MQSGETAGMLIVMNASFASGLSAYQGAAAQLSRAAGKITAAARAPLVPALSPGAGTPGASAASPTAPIPRGGRAPSSSDIAEAVADIMKATHQAKLAATSIRAASDMVGELLDVTA